MLVIRIATSHKQEYNDALVPILRYLAVREVHGPSFHRVYDTLLSLLVSSDISRPILLDSLNHQLPNHLFFKLVTLSIFRYLIRGQAINLFKTPVLLEIQEN